MNAVLDRPIAKGPASPAPIRPAGRRLPAAPANRRIVRRLLAAAALALFAAGGVAAWRLSQAPAPAPVPPRPDAVSALGYLEPKSELIRLAAPTAAEGARVERLLVKEGDDVPAGAIVAVLDSHDRKRAAVAEAAARVEVERAKLARIAAGAKPGDVAAGEAAVGRARASVRNAEANYGRVERLARSAKTPYDLDQARFALEAAREDLRHAEAALESLREVREVDLKEQAAQIAAAEAALEAARAELATTEVRTPVAGRVLEIAARPGERVGEAGILEIGDVSEMVAVAEVYEADLPKVREGQAATVRLFAGEGAALRGRVTGIGLRVAKKDVLEADPVADTDARVVEVRVRLNPEDGRRVAGLSNARVEVVIDAADRPPGKE